MTGGGARARGRRPATRPRSPRRAASGPSAAGACFAFQRPAPRAPATSAAPTAPSACPAATRALGAGLVGWRDAPTPDRARTTPTRSPRWRPTPRPAPARSRSATGGSCGWSAQAQLVAAAARRLAPPPRAVAPRAPGEQLGRPSIVGADGRLPPRRHAPARSIRLLDLATGRESLLRSERRALLSNPSFDGRRVLYVRSTYTRQELRLGSCAPQRRPATARSTAPRRPPAATRATRGPPPPLRRLQGGKPPPLAPRPPAGVIDTLWTTALGPSAAYVTRLRKRSGVTTATMLSVPR